MDELIEMAHKLVENKFALSPEPKEQEPSLIASWSRSSIIASSMARAASAGRTYPLGRPRRSCASASREKPYVAWSVVVFFYSTSHGPSSGRSPTGPADSAASPSRRPRRSHSAPAATV